MKQNLFSNLTKKNNKLEYNIKAQERIFNKFVEEIKRQAGLCFNKGGSEYCKSFGDCSKLELSSVIQELIKTGDDVGSNLR
jgi:hypothetical protein